MLALFGEKNVKIFHNNSDHNDDFIIVSHNEFLKSYVKKISAIIVDRSCVDFHLDKIKNTNLYDACRSVQCKKKIANKNEHVNLVFRKYTELFSKEDFCIQTCSITDIDFFNVITSAADNIFMIEDIVYEFCKSVTDIGSITWWIYVAEHQSDEIKIIGGFGSGIVYSRLFYKTCDIEKKVLETIKFLTREGLDKNVKIISFVNDFNIEGLNIIKPQKSFDNIDIESKLIKLFMNNDFNPKFSKDSYIRRYLNENKKEIFLLLMISLCFCIVIFMYLCNREYETKNFITECEKHMDVLVNDTSQTLSVKLNKNNLVNIKKFINIQLQVKDPIEQIKIISDFLKKNNIKAEKVFIDNYKNIKIGCTLSSYQLNKLKKISTNRMDVTVNKVEKIESEYEDLNESPNKCYGVEICVNMK
ncbi:MAG: hypothetical protein IJ730_00160 [Alphaproteobacteria bacterium]|nr:hypothetical protein [Alphaproteobacteria bacterium]